MPAAFQSSIAAVRAEAPSPNDVWSQWRTDLGLSFRSNRIMLMLRFAALAFGMLCVLASSTSARSEDINLCDRLASEDASRAPVVALEDIDPQQAQKACATAVAADPANPALIHQYARALERAGRLDDARRLYDWAATDGYAPAVAARARLSGIATAPEWPAADREVLGSQMAGTASALRRYAEQLPADPADPLAILAATGTGPEAILAWVASHIRSAAYAGSLRGAHGVLSDRTGNSLDRALLLSTLLTQAGQEVRLARATLGPAEVEALLPATGRSVDLPQLPPQTSERLLAQFADAKLPADQLAAAATAVADRRAQIAALLADRTATLLPVLLAAAQPAADRADADARSTAVTALADHFWVQVRAGTGWRDLDPDAELIGPQVPLETLAPADLPTALRHAVTLRVVLELQDQTGRREELLLTHTVYPADDGTLTLTLSHTAKGLDAIEQLLATPDMPKRTLEVLDGVTAWTPILDDGHDVIVDKLFTRDGALRAANLGAFAETGGTAAGLFEDASTLLSGETPDTKATAIPTAEWLEIEVRVPGAEPRIERRTIFDLIGPAARASGGLLTMTPELLRSRALQLVGVTDILITGTAPSEIGVARTGATTVARIADNLRAFAATPDGASLMDVPTGPRTPLILLQFASRRFREAGEAALTSPNVFLMHDRFGWNASAGASRQTEFDIVFNDVAGEPFVGRVRQGLIDTILENALLGDPKSGNAAALHAVDLASGRPWQRLTMGDVTQLAALSPDARARVEADLNAGYIVVTPAGASAVTPSEAWWRIDPRTGTTLGMMSSGGGTELAQYALLISEATSSAACFVGLGIAAVGIVQGRAGLVVVSASICLAAAAGGVAGTGFGLVVGGGGVIGVLIAYGVAG